jgi:hypothetical protein
VKCLVVQALAASIERDGVMLAFADIDIDIDIDGVMLLGFSRYVYAE